jgi:CBS domain-containing protein
MVSPVVTVDPQTSVARIARILCERRISGVPVVAGGRLVGMVTEADLLRRHEIGTDNGPPGESWWMRLLRDAESPSQYVRTHAVRARDIMSRDVVSVPHDALLATVASLLERRDVRRVPVVRGGRLVGIVSRSDLVRALALRPPAAPLAGARDDAMLQDALVAELLRQPWWSATYSSAAVHGGVVHFYGLIGTDAERHAARVAAENVLGERPVVDHRLSFYECRDA